MSPANLKQQSSKKLASPIVDAPEEVIRVEGRSGLVSALVQKSGSAHKARNATRNCRCHHAKSIHARMYANKALGTACNYPGCNCKSYRPA
jgi:hypothetical protein